MQPTLPPYALSAPAFPFRHLAALAGRAPIGGAREVALACFVAARLAADHLQGVDALPEPSRAARSVGARGWLGTMAIPAAVRTPLARCLELSVEGSSAALALELRTLADAADAWLDAGARGELESLAGAIGG